MTDAPRTSPAVQDAADRFVECRWSQPAEASAPAHCTHRDVLPLAGIHGFRPDAWCADCQYFKQKRKRRQNVTPGPPRW